MEQPPAMIAMPFPVAVWSHHPDRWPDSFANRAKTLLLFFDALGAFLTPAQAINLTRDDEYGVPMLEAGLLKVIDPGILVDGQMALSFNLALELALERMSTSGARDPRDTTMSTVLRPGQTWGWPLSFSRMGFSFQPELVAKNVNRLIELGWAEEVGGPSAEAVSLNALAADVTSTILSELVRSSAARSMGIDVRPVLAGQSLWGEDSSARLREVGDPMLYSEIILGDSRIMVPDLARVPLDELIDFRRQHGASFRAYLRDVSSYCMEVSLAPPEERHLMGRARQLALLDATAELGRLSRASWPGYLTSVGLGGVGIAWAASSNSDLWGAVLAAIGGVVGVASNQTRSDVGPLQYLLNIQSEWAER